jgi:2-dehydropantoate 2-reductase
MKFAIIGAGAVGGYYGARLANAGHDVTFIARGAHLEAIRTNGLSIRSVLGDLNVRVPATADPSSVRDADLVILAVKSYDNDTALAAIPPMAGDATTVLTLQNGVDSVDQVAAVVGREKVLGGATYIAAAVTAPGVIEQTGTHRRIVFGEVTGATSGLSERVSRIHEAFTGADIHSEPVADARVPLWTKFIYLAPFAGFTGAARLPIGPLWSEQQFREMFLAAAKEIEDIARAEGVALPASLADDMLRYVDSLPGATRSSLLIDLQQGKRIELEALPGSVVRRGRAAGIPTPIMSTLYAVLKPYVNGARSS